MLFAKYWAEEKLVYKAPHIRKGQKGAQIVIKRKGWSNESQEAAQTHAYERAQSALQQILDHPKDAATILRHEAAHGYNGADALPICEEVVLTSGDAAITRNTYGALCLNTPDVMFLDIDEESGVNLNRTPRLSCRYLMLLCIFLFLPLYAYFDSIMYACCISVTFTLSIDFIVNHLLNNDSIEKRIDKFAALNPTWRFNLYRTAAGFRVLVLHQLFDPAAPQTWDFFRTLGVDPIYQRMCCLQKCFRARLTPKPWRMMLDTIPKGRLIWRSEFMEDPIRLAWITEYEHASTNYAVCTLVKQYGDPTGVLAPKIKAILELHDRYTKINQSLPLA